MRRIVFLVASIAFSITFLLTSGGSSARAEDLTPEQVERVKTNCVAIKTSLNQLHASDALLRVNRGQIYESMASKFMDNFNNRLASNRLDNKAMITVTTKYRSALDTFRLNYIAYEQKLSEAIKIDCATQPNTFHDAVVEARELRSAVHADVLKLHLLIDDYRSSVGGFLLNFERLSE